MTKLDSFICPPLFFPSLTNKNAQLHSSSARENCCHYLLPFQHIKLDCTSTDLQYTVNEALERKGKKQNDGPLKLQLNLTFAS